MAESGTPPPSPEQVQGALVGLLRLLADRVEELPADRFDPAAAAPTDLLEDRYRQRRLAVQVLAGVSGPLSLVGGGLTMDAHARGRHSVGLEMTQQASMALARLPLLRHLADGCTGVPAPSHAPHSSPQERP